MGWRVRDIPHYSASHLQCESKQQVRAEPQGEVGAEAEGQGEAVVGHLRDHMPLQP